MAQNDSNETNSDSAVTGSDSESQERGTKRTARQLLHWATGDRDAEAKALADAADAPVSEEAAKRAVQAAHGDIPSDKSYDDSEVATPSDLDSSADADTSR